MKRSPLRLVTLSPCHPVTSPRGTALTAAILMLVLVSAAVTTMMVLFATEARRTHSTIAGAQLRQLLLAAQPAALAEIQKSGPAARDLTLPTPVPSTALTLHIAPDGPDKALVRVLAKSPPDLAAQTLTYTRTAERWHLQSAALGFQP